MLSVQTNMAAENAARQLGINTKRNAKRSEKLSSGYRINRSADDAAGLSISEKMRRQVRGLTQAAANAQDGISMVQIGEGALNEVHDMLQRANELAIHAATGTLQKGDRMMIDAEIQQLKAEIDKTARNTTFNDIPIFPDNGRLPKEAGYVETKSYNISINLTDGTVLVNDEEAQTGAAAGTRAASGGEQLADKIANEYVPNAIKQIMDTFPVFKTAMGSETVELALEISYDGPNGTLATASYSYYYYPTAGRPIDMKIWVDSADYSDADLDDSTGKLEMLESTLAHELMHSVMQYTLTDGMSGRAEGNTPSYPRFPQWFREGTAQLAGGGFPTNWNNWLFSDTKNLANAEDGSKDAAIKQDLQRYTMANRPYGHGYLGCAYLGYLANRQANGSTAVTSAAIADGMNLIYGDLLAGKTLEEAMHARTGISTIADLESKFANGDAGLVEFVRKVGYNSQGGAGSIIVGSLNMGGSDIIGTGAPQQMFRIKMDSIVIDYSVPGSSSGGTGTSGGSGNTPWMVALQVGAEAGIHIDVDLYQMNTKGLEIEDLNVKTTEDADKAINSIKRAIGYVSNVRSQYGAIQNRLEYTIRNLNNITENTAAAESRIRDTEIAGEMVGYSNDQVLMQAGASVLAQANQSSQLILSLLG